MVRENIAFTGWLAGLSAPGKAGCLGDHPGHPYVRSCLAPTLFLKRYGPCCGRPCRTLILLVGGAGALLLTDQGAEIAEGLTDDGWWMPVLFVLSVSFWAWQSWFWSRAALNLRFGPN